MPGPMLLFQILFAVDCDLGVNLSKLGFTGRSVTAKLRESHKEGSIHLVTACKYSVFL